MTHSTNHPQRRGPVGRVEPVDEGGRPAHQEDEPGRRVHALRDERHVERAREHLEQEHDERERGEEEEVGDAAELEPGLLVDLGRGCVRVLLGEVEETHPRPPMRGAPPGGASTRRPSDRLSLQDGRTLHNPTRWSRGRVRRGDVAVRARRGRRLAPPARRGGARPGARDRLGDGRSAALVRARRGGHGARAGRRHARPPERACAAGDECPSPSPAGARRTCRSRPRASTPRSARSRSARCPTRRRRSPSSAGSSSPEARSSCSSTCIWRGSRGGPCRRPPPRPGPPWPAAAGWTATPLRTAQEVGFTVVRSQAHVAGWIVEAVLRRPA